MTELYEKSLRTLELDRVLEMLSECAGSDEARERCLGLRPSESLPDVERRQEETAAACRLLSLKGTPGFSGIKNVASALERADMGGSLSTRELLDIAGVLRTARSVRAWHGSAGEEKTCIDHLFAALRANRPLEDRITNSIISEEEIADAASAELADIRRHMRIANAKARESLQRIISSPAFAKYLREPIITIRSDRYVVPVKSEHKNEIPGLVHDVSASGSTLFIEPMQAVNANNELRELLAKEKKEIERILAELSAEAAAQRTDILDDYDILIMLDMIFARAQLAFRMDAVRPAVGSDGRTDLKRARHPLIERGTVVPVSVQLGGDFDTLVITGPNTGGKTVTLKTLGLLTLMAECGLHIPADDGSRVSVFDRVLADIGDEQSIEQSLSTFSSHMKNIVSIISEADMSTLVLFDELGAGTDPVEGAALAVSVIEYCRMMGAKVAATTHYAELKVYAMRTDGVQNASCEFDVETLRPTYRLLIGIPGKSNAFAISRRLGLPEGIIEKARELIDEENASFEDVITQLEQQRQAMEAARVEAERLRLETEDSKKKAEEYREAIRKERERATRSARAEAQRIIDDARSTANAVFAELSDMRKRVADAAVDWQRINAERAELGRRLNEAEDAAGGRQDEPERPEPSRAPRAGDTVELRGLGTKAEVISVDKDGNLMLQAGVMKIKAKPSEVWLLEDAPKADVKNIVEQSKAKLKTLGATPEIDLRGMDSIEALSVLDMFLDNAQMANLPSVRVIHGKGTGVLRKAVGEHLKKNKSIRGFRLGVFGEGEDGVTIVDLS